MQPLFRSGDVAEQQSVSRPSRVDGLKLHPGKICLQLFAVSTHSCKVTGSRARR